MDNEIKKHENNDIALLSGKAVTDILSSVNKMEVISSEDSGFLQEHKEHLGKVLSKTHIWRTDEQKLSIISDGFCPTLHAKFHQAILEQKVQFDQSLYLAKDFELAKLNLKEILLDLEELSDSPRDQIKAEKLQIEIQFREYELQQMKTAMIYRMKEVKGWQNIQNGLLREMKHQGYTEEHIWNKDAGQSVDMFLQALTNLHGIKVTKDGAEHNNLLSLAQFSYHRMKEGGMLEQVRKVCSPMQLESLKLIEGS